MLVSKRQPFVEGVKKRAVRSFLGFSIQLPLGGFTVGTESVGNRNKGSDKLETHKRGSMAVNSRWSTAIQVEKQDEYIKKVGVGVGGIR